MKIIDDFLDDPEFYRNKALSGHFENLKAFDGQTYERVQPYDSSEVHDKLEQEFGPVLMLGSGFRLNYGDELPNNGRHVDVGWGTHALVIYLSSSPNGGLTGTAFWDTTNDDAFMTGICEEQFNRCVIYKSDQPHSRWPLEAYGDCPENGRLIFVAFFSPLGEL